MTTLPTSPAAAQPAPIPTSPVSASVTREISAGELIGTTLNVWWRNVFKFAGMTLLLVFVPMVFVAALVVTAMARRGAAPEGAELTLLSLLPFPLVTLTMIVLTGALTYGAIQHLAGRPVRFGAMLTAGFHRVLPILATGLVTYVLVLAGLLLLVIPGVIVGCALTVAIPAAAIEQRGPVQAIERSWALTRDNRATIFLAWLVLGFIVFAANLVLSLVSTLLGPIGGLVFLPIQLCALALPTLFPAVAYHDLRAVKEGTATDELARVFE